MSADATPTTADDRHPSRTQSTPDAAERDAQEPTEPVYDFDIDVDSESTHAIVVRWVGRDRRVLELGPATGYMSKVFTERGCSVVGIEIDPAMAKRASRYCEKVIIGDIDSLDLESRLGSERFDVIVAADVLEHLKDPLGALRRLRPFLEPESGVFVVSLPNIAHGSVRLALLQGKFSYQDLGLLDRTHLRFFTRESIEQMFDDAELAIGEFRRQELNLDASEVDFDQDAVPPELVQAIAQDADARTYQFILKAFPINQPGMRGLQERVRSQAEAHDATRRELDGAKRELDTLREQLASLNEQLRARETIAAELAQREGQLRTSLVDAHDQTLRRDEEISRLLAEVERLQQFEAERAELLRANQELHRAQSEARDIIAAKTEEGHRLRVRLDRLMSSPPARLWYRLGGLPVIRRVVARRTAGYLAAVDRSRGG